MSVQRRIRKQMSQPIAMAGTSITFNGCKVYLGSPNPATAKKAAGFFVKFMAILNSRACLVNMHDLYNAHFKMLQRIESGEVLAGDN